MEGRKRVAHTFGGLDRQVRWAGRFRAEGLPLLAGRKKTARRNDGRTGLAVFGWMGLYLNATGIGAWSQQPNFQRTPSITSLEVMWLISRPL
jgi:hypothetical protein